VAPAATASKTGTNVTVPSAGTSFRGALRANVLSRREGGVALGTVLRR
jgi:hypothetical protein